MAIKSCEEKILLKLPIRNKRQAGFQSNENGKALGETFKVDSPQNRLKLIKYPDLDPAMLFLGLSLTAGGMCAHQKTHARTFVLALPQHLSTVK